MYFTFSCVCSAGTFYSKLVHIVPLLIATQSCFKCDFFPHQKQAACSEKLTPYANYMTPPKILAASAESAWGTHCNVISRCIPVSVE